MSLSTYVSGLCGVLLKRPLACESFLKCSECVSSTIRNYRFYTYLSVLWDDTEPHDFLVDPGCWSTLKCTYNYSLSPDRYILFLNFPSNFRNWSLVRRTVILVPSIICYSGESELFLPTCVSRGTTKRKGEGLSSVWSLTADVKCLPFYLRTFPVSIVSFQNKVLETSVIEPRVGDWHLGVSVSSQTYST